MARPELTCAQVDAAADLLVLARQGQLVIPELPDHCKPHSMADAQRICDATTARLALPVVGWKVYFSYKALELPNRTPIYEPLASPARIPASRSPLRLIEPEVLFRLTADLPGRVDRYSYDEVASAMELAPAFEVIAPRYHFESLDALYARIKGPREFDSFADHNASGLWVVGEYTRDWQKLDLPKMRTVMQADNRLLCDVIGGHPFLEPFLPLLAFANLMRSEGGLQKGTVLGTSSFTSFFQVEIGERVTCDFAGLGAIEATFVEG
jgi:2-keto-4-pentenoate hydratase